MKNRGTILAFISIAAIIGGLVLLASYASSGYSSDDAAEGFFGVVLLAAGLTRFWITSRFYHKDSD
jgi:preprotein translocase subunit SecG